MNQTKNILAALALGIGLMTGIPVLAQATQRIDFAREGNNLIWEEQVAPKSKKIFLLRARKGQKLTLSMVDDTNVGTMKLGKMSIQPNADPTTITVEESKEFELVVSNNSDVATSFRIGASLNDPAPSKSAGEKVKFLDNNANLTRNIPANGSLTFLVSAKKGQTLGIQLGYEGKASDLKGTLQEPGSLASSLSLEAESRREFLAKSDGEHRLMVTNQSGRKVTFTLYLDLQ